MGKMMKNENIIRPRRHINSRINSLDTQKISKISGSMPVFKMGENDFVVSLPQFTNTSGTYHYKNDVANRKPKSIARQLLHQIEHYCEKTTLHGLRYVGDTSLTIGERIFWFVAFSVAISFAAYYIGNIYKKWNSSPVIISFSPFDAELSSIPFPAITICNMNQAKKSEAERILTEGNTVEKKLLNDVCNGNQTFTESEQYNWATLRNFLIRVGSSCSETLKICEWSNDNKNCEELFNNDLTDEGLCCSFNRLPPSKIFRNINDISLLNQTYPGNVHDWNPEIGFSEENGEDENLIPKKPLGAGSHLGLTVVMDAQVDNYYCSSTSSVGFKIILSNPIETPKMADFGSLLSPGVEARYSISPSVREASSNLRNIPLQKRQCYFANERRLSYYRKYTKMNCDSECLSKHIFEKCKCVPYYLPKNSSMPFCEQIDDDCVVSIRNYISRIGANRSDCDCLYLCDTLGYTYQITYAKISDNFNQYIITDITKQYFAKNMVIVNFYFDNTQYAKMYKRELFTSTDIVANIGGLLGAFLGFSVLTAIELLYHIMLKLVWRSYTNSKKRSYTQRNCNLECQSNYTYDSCSCIPYYLPRNKTIKACGKTDQECTNTAKEDMENTYGNGSSCNCLPGCFEIVFTDSKSYAKLSPFLMQAELATNFSGDYFTKNMAIAHFFFPSSKFTKQVKSELYGFTEILANIGGLLGLCMGFSFLSIVEIIYFITLRVFCNYFKVQRKKKLSNQPRDAFQPGIFVHGMS